MTDIENREIEALIVDDEQASRNLLKKMVAKSCPYVDVLGEASNAAEAIELIQNLKPQLVFLDIEMPGGDGFSVLDKFKSQDFHVIFTTAYNEYALKAIKYAALDYILKPLNAEEIKSAIEMSRERIYHSQQFTVLRTFYENKNRSQHIILPGANSNRIVLLEDVVKLKAQNNYVIFTMMDGSNYIASQNLQHYSDLLPNDMFYRIHRSCVVNLHRIESFDKGNGGSTILVDGSIEKIATRRKSEFVKHLKEL
jgi:two-component system LytT family response regulator